MKNGCGCIHSTPPRRSGSGLPLTGWWKGLTTKPFKIFKNYHPGGSRHPSKARRGVFCVDSGTQTNPSSVVIFPFVSSLDFGVINYMKIALNGATTMHADLLTDIKAASAAGFDLLEIWSEKLYEFLKAHTPADLKILLAEHNLQPYSINSIEHVTFRTAEDYAEVKAECETLSKIGGEIGCQYIVVVPGLMPENGTKEQVVEETVRVLNELADISEPYGVSLAFEFLGQTDCSVRTLDLCNEIVEKVDRQSIGN